MFLKRFFTLRRIGIFVAAYVLLWALTALIGCRQARRFALARAELPSGIREMAPGSVYECCAPVYWLHARSYAPFCVTLSFDFAAGDFAYGYTHVFLWFGVLGPGITTSSGIT
jgi:hypothetical protein